MKVVGNQRPFRVIKIIALHVFFLSFAFAGTTDLSQASTSGHTYKRVHYAGKPFQSTCRYGAAYSGVTGIVRARLNLQTPLAT